MAGTQVQHRRGTTAEHTTFTGAAGEITVDTTKKTAVVHDGSTAGGFALQRADQAAIATQLQPISASVAANALTISAAALSLDFRSTTLGSGTVTRVAGTPSNLVVPSTATLGTTSAVQSDLYVLALNNAGTIELAAVNATGGVDLSETGLISTTAISAAATSASTVYSTTARSNVAYRVIGVVRSTQATAGTWVTAPSLVQGAGGNSLDAMHSLGHGQTWQVVTRSLGVNYYNTTGKPIVTTGYGVNPTVGNYIYAIVNGANVVMTGFPVSSQYAAYSCVIPAGAVYSFQVSGGTLTITAAELR